MSRAVLAFFYFSDVKKPALLLALYENTILVSYNPMLRDNKMLMLYDAVIVTLFVVLPYVTKIHEPPPPKRNKR